MKTLDELGDDAIGYASSDTLGEINPEAYTERQIGLLHGYIDGYIQCQKDMGKTYTLDEVKKLLIQCKDRFGGSELEDYTSDKEVIDYFNRYLNK